MKHASLKTKAQYLIDKKIIKNESMATVLQKVISKYSLILMLANE